MIDISKIKIGDFIMFKAATREHCRTATRKVTGFYLGEPTVGYHGCRNFVVHVREIIAHQTFSAKFKRD